MQLQISNTILLLVSRKPLPYQIYAETLRPRQNERHFGDDICKCIFLKGNVSISIRSNQHYHSFGSDNGLAQTRLKPLSEAMLISLLTHIFVTRPQGFNFILCVQFTFLYMSTFYHPQLYLGWYKTIARFCNTKAISMEFGYRNTWMSSGRVVDHLHIIFYEYNPTHGCDIQGFRTMILNARYRPWDLTIRRGVYQATIHLQKWY